jgi:hypothetical protein
MAELDRNEFKFPDEKGAPTEEKVEFEIEGEGDAEVEVVDDTPPEDRGRTPMKEPPAEVTDDELEKYSADVKKRIQHFSKGYHEERRAKEAAQREKEEAIRLAQNLIEENKKLQGSLGQGQQVLIEQAKKVVASELDEAKRKYKAAYEAGDADAIVAAQEELTAAKIRAERVNDFKPPALQQTKTDVQPAPQAQPQVQFDSKARAWQNANPWFGSNDEMTAVALTVHKRLVESGVSTDSDEYYEKINSRVRQLFPDAFPSEKPVEKPVKKASVVAPATRSTAPKKIVLTQSQVNIAKRLGVPLEVYARQVAEELRNQNV